MFGRKWKVETFFFADADYAVWRTRGHELQFRMARAVPAEDEALRQAKLLSWLDPAVEAVGESLYLIGWVDRSDDPNARMMYDADKKAAINIKNRNAKSWRLHP